jgi:hypothetical protein
MNIAPGDLIFYPDDGNWRHHFFAWIQKIGGELGTYTGTPITHVAMISTEPDLIIEMAWPRPRFRFFADDTRAKIIMRPDCDEIYKMRAIYNCYLDIAESYSFFDMVLGKFGFTKAHKVCSAWIDAAYKEAGFNLTPVSDNLVSPNEMISSSNLLPVRIG